MNFWFVLIVVYNQINAATAFTLYGRGQFSPFWSNAVLEVNDSVERATKISSDISKLINSTTFKEKLQQQNSFYWHVMADKKEKLLVEWEKIMTLGKRSDDFQLREFQLLGILDIFATSKNAEIEAFLLHLEYEVNFAQALAEERKVPLPGWKVIKSHFKLRRCRQKNGKSQQLITAPPFTREDLESQSEVVKDEYAALLEEHEYLIRCGADFGSFCAKDKLEFLDELEDVEERWDIVFARFNLMQALNPEYIRQSKAFLSELDWNGTSYRELHRACRQRMRDEAVLEMDDAGHKPAEPVGRKSRLRRIFGSFRSFAVSMRFT